MRRLSENLAQCNDSNDAEAMVAGDNEARRRAIAANGEAWTLLEKRDRTAEETGLVEICVDRP